MASDSQSTNRRSFLATTSAAVVAATAAGKTSLAASVTPHTFGEDTIRVALVGCGGRGVNAVEQIFSTPGPVKLVAVADAFEYRTKEAVTRLSDHAVRIGGKVEDYIDVPDERRFVGLDAYKKAVETDCDLVVLATPPGFRPAQFEAAVNARKHVFMEKP
ncbi:MAG: Gfo/Idh/MocA family oxidoreductase, partial [Planctomycetales bacterium]|nr:Gfo/Idh/MocA family oxidoreductase [Planctomycetales bacterium]